MILVTLGTQDKSFKRLLEEVDKLIEDKIITDEVIVQAGSTKYESANMKIFDLIPKDEFEKLMKDARIIITHAGVGSILTGLLNNKKVIAVPRLKKYGEHVNDHQLEIIEVFTGKGYILGCREVDDLKSSFMEIPKFKPKKYQETTENLVKYIATFIEKC